ncbi:MAG: hypothetical protein ABIH50_06385, partial [bacterium]
MNFKPINFIREKIPRPFPRIFKVKPLAQLPEEIRVRKMQGYLSPANQEVSLLEIMAGRIGIRSDLLGEMGINEKRIDLPALRQFLEEGIPKGIKVRHDEERSVDNVISAIVGRIGEEKEVFVPIKRKEAQKFIDRDDLTDEQARQAFNVYIRSLSLAGQVKFLCEYGAKERPGNNESQANLLLYILADIHAEAPFNLGKMIALIAEKYYDDEEKIGQYIRSAGHFVLEGKELPFREAYIKGMLSGLGVADLAEYFFVTDLESAIRSEDLAARAEALEKMVNNLDSFDGMYDKNDYIV